MPTLSMAFHAILGIFAFGALLFPGIYFSQVAKTENVAAIRAAFAVAALRGKVFGPVAILVALFGFYVAYAKGVSLGSSWLIASYITFVIIMVIGIGYHARNEMKIYNLAMASPTDAASPELKAAIHSPLERPMHIVSLIGWILLFFFMIAKPSF